MHIYLNESYSAIEQKDLSLIIQIIRGLCPINKMNDQQYIINACNKVKQNNYRSF